MNDNIDIDGAFNQLRDAVAAEFDSSGQAMVSDMQHLLGVDVEYYLGPRGGIRTIRSLPGEPPRRDTGQLQDSIYYIVQPRTAGVDLCVYSESLISVYLERGSRHVAPRPHWQPLYEQWSEELPARVADAIEAATQN